jgi:3-oxoacyl-[acyl-carrier-protein] synthase II
MNKNRVVVTGLGVLLKDVNGKEECWSKILKGKQDFDIIDEVVNGLKLYRYIGKISNFELKDCSPIVLKQTDDAIQYAMYAAKMALKDSNLELNNELLDEMGLFFGSELGGLTYAENEYKNIVENGYRYLSPYLTIGHFYSAPIGQLSIELKIKGYSKTYCNGECSSSIAIGEAYRTISDDLAKVIVSGGFDKADTNVVALIYNSTEKLAFSKSMDHIPENIPYGDKNGGIVISSGSSALVLEEYEYAKSRNAHIYCEIKAFQQGFSDKDDIRVLKNIIFSALNEANIKEKDITYVHGSAYGLAEHDKNELEILKGIFGNEIIIGCPGSIFGNTLGAFGSTQMVASILAIENNKYPFYKNDYFNHKYKNTKYILVLTRSLEGDITVIILKK